MIFIKIKDSNWITPGDESGCPTCTPAKMLLKPRREQEQMLHNISVSAYHQPNPTLYLNYINRCVSLIGSKMNHLQASYRVTVDNSLVTT